ncbi:MAG: cytochrome c biogenesis protein CcsA [bacterium]
MSPFAWETTLHWSAVALYLAGLVGMAYALIFVHPEKRATALWLTAAGLLPHAAALVLRYLQVGHGPYMMKYEVLSSNAWIAVALLLLFLWRRPGWSALALVVLPVSILMLGFGLFTNPEARDLPPTLRSMWLVFHVLFNKLAVGAFLLSAAAAVILLCRLAGRSSRFLDRMPDAVTVEACTVRFIGFGMVFWTTTIGAGAIWANQSWGRYWGWDPIETWSLVTWLSYAILLHARLFFRLKPRTLAWGTIACFLLSILTILIFPFVFPSMHSAYFQ